MVTPARMYWHECLRDAGGFSHNQFALTLVHELEIRFTAFPD